MQTNDYCKLYFGYADYFDPLNDAEVGRLVRAMIAYKRDGVEPEFTGNERFVWPAIKRDIDFSNQRQREISEARSKAGKRGGRPRKDAGEKVDTPAPLIQGRFDALIESLHFDFTPAAEFYLENVSESPTTKEFAEFAELVAEMQDNDCAIEVIETCLELRHKEWPYIRAALQQKIDSGTDYLEAYKISEKVRRDNLKFINDKKEGRLTM